MHRVIPILLIDNGDLVKTVAFQSPRYIGDPINAIKIFNEKEVDEIAVIDISRSSQPNIDLLKSLVDECFMPMTYIGGVSSISHFDHLFSLGIEKIGFNTLLASASRDSIIREAVKRYGAQSIVACVDYKISSLGNRIPVTGKNNTEQNESLESFCLKLEKLGIGEIVLQSIDRDGTMSGYDILGLSTVSSLISVPIVALGGAGNITHCKDAIKHGASAVAAGSMFVYHGIHKAVLITYPDRADIEAL